MPTSAALRVLPLFGLLLAARLLPVQAQEPRPETAAARAQAYTRYLAPSLRLPPHQYQALYRCTLRRVLTQDSLTAAGPAGPGPRQTDADQRYAAAVQAILSPAQFASFRQLWEQQPGSPPAARAAPLSAARP